MTYTRPGWKPVTTELNDPSMSQSKTVTQRIWDDLEGRWRELIAARESRILHKDWCDDRTCWCSRGTGGATGSSTT